jgi:hypothetical protein
MTHFSPAEASKTLPLIKRIVADILQAGQQGRQLIEDNKDDSEQLQLIESELKKLFEELAFIGCEYKDWNYEIGLIDFPSTIHDQKVFLCWRSDEPELLYYHGIYEGYSGRKLIPQHLLETSHA